MSIYSGSRFWVDYGTSFYTIDADSNDCITESEASAHTSASFNFSLHDTDRDGCLRDDVPPTNAASEFRSAFPLPPETTFVDVDGDGNSCITPVEAAAFGMTQEYFSLYDADGDGCLKPVGVVERALTVKKTTSLTHSERSPGTTAPGGACAQKTHMHTRA